MTLMIECPKCGAQRDASNRFTSPANVRRDAEQWEQLHRDGKCVEAAALDRQSARAAQEARYYAIDDKVRALRKQQSDLARQIDADSLAAKPTFPTDAMREGMALALQRLRDGYESKSHHGDPCGPEYDAYCVVVESQARRISVRDGSPYKFVGSGRLWQFETDDRLALFALVEAAGFIVFDHWLHDVGISILARERE